MGTALMRWLSYRRLWSLKAEVWVQGPAHRNQLQLLHQAAKEAHDALLQIELKSREIILPPSQQQNLDLFMYDTLDSPKLLQQKGLFAVCGPASHLTCIRVAHLNPRLLLRRGRGTLTVFLPCWAGE